VWAAIAISILVFNAAIFDELSRFAVRPGSSAPNCLIEGFRMDFG